MKKHRYPIWICIPCGVKLGKIIPSVYTCHENTCEVCGTENVMVSEPRDFGHLVEDWENIAYKDSK